MGNRVGVIAQQRLLLRLDPEQTVLLRDQMAQAQHAQTDLDGVILVAARNMHMCAARANRCTSASTRTLSSSMDNASPASSNAVATSATGSTGSTLPTFCINTLASRSTSAKRAC